MSFRTEVALAAFQESNPQESRRLIALINGTFEGSSYMTVSSRIISEILEKIIHEAEQYQYLQYADDPNPIRRSRMKTIGQIYRNRKQLSRNVIDNLTKLQT